VQQTKGGVLALRPSDPSSHCTFAGCREIGRDQDPLDAHGCSRGPHPSVTHANKVATP
jgi:hypothetical protein